MGHLVSKGINGTVSYKGTQYVNPDRGTHKLCLRTGLGSGDVVKYGLTSNSSASQYCGMKMRIDGNVAYIGRSEVSGGGEPNVYYESSMEETGGQYSYTTYSRTGSLGIATNSSVSNTRIISTTNNHAGVSITDNSTIVRSFLNITSGTSTYRNTVAGSRGSYYSSVSTMTKQIMTEHIFGIDNPDKKLINSVLSSSSSTLGTLFTRSTTYNYATLNTYYTKSATGSDLNVQSFLSSLDGKKSLFTYYGTVYHRSSYSTTSQTRSTSRWSTRSGVEGCYSSCSLTIEDVEQEVTDNVNL